MSSDPRNQPGVALITVLMILAVVAGLTLTLSNITSQATHDIKDWHTYNTLYYATLAGESYGMALLNNNFEENKTTFKLTSALRNARVFPGDDKHSPNTFVTIDDLQGRFNIIELTRSPGLGGTTDAVEIFSRYTRELGIPDHVRIDIQNIMSDQIAPISQQKVYFELLYETLNQLLVKGDITFEAASTFSNSFVALPVGTAVNFNTASEKLLVAMAPNISPASIKHYVNTRGEENEGHNNLIPQTTIDPVVSALSHSGINISATSRFFLVKSTSSIGDTRKTLHSFVVRDRYTGTTTLIYRYTPEFVQITPAAGTR